MKWMRRTSAAATIVVAAAVAGCGRKDAKGNPPTPVTVTRASVATVPFSVTANGVVEPLQTVAIQPQVAGQVVGVDFQEGQQVQKGQVLFRIDPRPFQAALAQAQAALTRDRVQADNAAREADRYGALVAKGYVTQSQADQQKALAASQAAVVQSDEAAVQVARLNLGYATIRAPITGLTGSLLVKPGNQVRVPNATPLVVINQLQPLLVRFTVPARTLSELQAVMRSGHAPQVQAVPSEMDTTSVHAPQTGSLEFMDNAVDTTTGTITLKARFANAGRALWPGQYVTVSLDLYDQRNALVVPTAAVQTGQEGDYVFVVDGLGRARMTPVQVARTVGETAVVAQGLLPGMRVVTDGQSRLFPGARVVVRGPGPDGGRHAPGGRPPKLGAVAPGPAGGAPATRPRRS